MTKNPPKQDFLDHKTKDIFRKLLILFIGCVSLIIMFGWITENKNLVELYLNSGSTMKFNTTLVFLCSVINLFLLKRKETRYIIIQKTVSALTIAIGGISLLSYFDFFNLNIDNLFIIDTFSKIHPGKISPATATCSIFIGIGFLGYNSEDKNFSTIGRFANSLTYFISALSILLFFCAITLKERTLFFESMSLSTSVFFCLLAFYLILFDKKSYSYEMFYTNYVGSKLYRSVLPKLIFFPIIIVNLLLVAKDYEYFNDNLVIVVLALSLVIGAYAQIVSFARRMNSADKERYELEQETVKLSEELTYFKETINKITSIVRTNLEGKVIYANDVFFKVTGFSKQDIYAKTYYLFNEENHTKENYKEFKSIIHKGKIWSDKKKTYKKDGTNYWVKTHVTPIINDDKKLQGFMIVEVLVEEN